MCAVSNCEIIVTCVHNIGLCCCIIIACKIFLRSYNFHSFGLTRFQLFCFLKTNQLNGSFFHIVFFVIVCIRSLCIKLYYIFARHISCIFHLNGNSYGIALIIEVFDILLKCCVGKSVAESIGNFLIIVPGTIIIGSSCRTVCISLFQNRVFISCFIIFIPCINAFALYQIVGATVIGCPKIVFCGICERIASEVYHSR